MDGILRPAQKMSISFNEPLHCAQPFDFTVTLQVGSNVYTNDDMDINCFSRTISLYPRRGFNWDDAVGKRATLKITGTKDEVGNANFGAANSFDVIDMDLTTVAVQWAFNMLFPDVHDDSINDPSGSLFQGIASKMSADLATITGEDASRFSVLVCEWREGSASTWCKIEIAPSASSTDPTATSVANNVNDVLNGMPHFDINNRLPFDEAWLIDAPVIGEPTVTA